MQSTLRLFLITDHTLSSLLTLTTGTLPFTLNFRPSQESPESKTRISTSGHVSSDTST